MSHMLDCVKIVLAPSANEVPSVLVYIMLDLDDMRPKSLSIDQISLLFLNFFLLNP